MMVMLIGVFLSFFFFFQILFDRFIFQEKKNDSKVL